MSLKDKVLLESTNPPGYRVEPGKNGLFRSGAGKNY